MLVILILAGVIQALKVLFDMYDYTEEEQWLRWGVTVLNFFVFIAVMLALADKLFWPEG